MATITKKLGFENLLQYASLGKDSDGDGVVDGWRAFGSASATTSWIFDADESAQMINVSNTADRSSVAIEYEPHIPSEGYIPVTEGEPYTLSAYMKVNGELPTGSGGQLLILWYDEEAPTGLIGSHESEIFVDEEFTRHTLTAAAPVGAKYARVRIAFVCSEAEMSGTLRAKWAQFQYGDTATDYEETDFFTIEKLAEDSSGESFWYGWVHTTSADGNRRLSSDVMPEDDVDHNGAYLKFVTPKEATNVTVTMDIDATELGEYDWVTVEYGEYYTVASVDAGEKQTVTFQLPRGPVGLILTHYRDFELTAPNAQAHIDNILVSYELEEAAQPPELPTADRVYTIDFESDQYDPFFIVDSKAPGYDYGFTRLYIDRHSGWYSFGVEETDVPWWFDEDSPPRIPDEEKAGAIIAFKIPLAADEPQLRFFVKFDGEDYYDEGRILLNDQEIWQSQVKNGWEEIVVPLTPGMQYNLLIEYISSDTGIRDGTDSIYIDDIVVSYNLPGRPYMYIATGQEVEVSTKSASTFTVTEDFETTLIDPFFTVKNPSRLKSGGGKSQYPETGWTYTTLEARGRRAFRAIYPDNSEDSAVDFTFQVPHGVRNAKAEWWNFVELERSPGVPKDAKYNRLYEEYRIWVNYSLWKDFHYCSPNLTESVHYTGPDSKGVPGNDYACPWGRWWKETLHLSPGQTYTLTFELQRDAGNSSDIHGRNLCVIDDLTVTWEETPGEVIITPPEPLIYLDDRDGYSLLYDRNGAEMTPLSFSEYKVFGTPGSIHQFTQIEPRDVDFLIAIKGESPEDLRQKVRELTSLLANKPLTLIDVDKEGNARMLNCRLSGIIGRETPDEHFNTWKKAVLSFRAFDPFWYGDWKHYDSVLTPRGEDPLTDYTFIEVENPGDVEAWPIIKVYGPVTDPVIKLNPGAIKQLKLTGFTVNPGRHIVIDTRPGKKTIILDDGQSLYQYLDSSVNDLFSIPPGKYIVDVDGSDTDDNTKIVVQFQPAYWGV